MPNSTNNDSIGADSMIREQPSEAMMGNANDNDDDIGKAKDDDGDDSDATEEYKSTMFAEDEDDALLQPPPAHAHARAQQMEQPQPQSTEQQDETNQQDKDDKLDAIEIASWGSNDSDVIEIIEPPSSNNGGNTLPNSPPSSSAASASFQSRSQNMPQWMANNNNSTTTSSNNAPKNESGMLPVSHNNYNPSIPGTANSSNSNAYTTTHGYGNSSNINHGNPYHSTSSYNNNSNPYYASSSSTSYHGIQQPQPHQPLPSYIQIPTSHTPTWSNILPKDYYSSQQGHHNNQYQYNSYGSSASQRKKLSLSLINMWEFTITIESLDYGYGGYNNRHEVIQGLRSNIKKIAREHVGREGRKGAIFERGSLGEGIVPDDPLLKQVTNSEGDADNSSQPTGRWRIPLGAYQQLMTYLISDRNNVVEGIPPEQLRAATLGRERQSKKEYAKVDELLKRLVSPSVCHALAPYQRGGVEFILDKEGRALLADGKYIVFSDECIHAVPFFSRCLMLTYFCVLLLFNRDGIGKDCPR